MKLVFAELAWEDYLYWQKQERKMVERINKLSKPQSVNRSWAQANQSLQSMRSQAFGPAESMTSTAWSTA